MNNYTMLDGYISSYYFIGDFTNSTLTKDNWSELCFNNFKTVIPQLKVTAINNSNYVSEMEFSKSFFRMPFHLWNFRLSMYELQEALNDYNIKFNVEILLYDLVNYNHYCFCTLNNDEYIENLGVTSFTDMLKVG